LIDLNRPPDSASSIVTRSEATDVPGNLALPGDERDRRIKRIFDPYHRAVEQHLAHRLAARRPIVIVAIHSFTPVYHDVPRPTHVGVLFEKSVQFADAVIETLRTRHPDLNVGANVPYTVSSDEDYGLLVYGDNRGNAAVEFEVRQDLLLESRDQTAWAHRLAEGLTAGLAIALRSIRAGR
jgi:predicted N-formylglutamate amidohydrolase